MSERLHFASRQSLFSVSPLPANSACAFPLPLSPAPAPALASWGCSTKSLQIQGFLQQNLIPSPLWRGAVPTLPLRTLGEGVASPRPSFWKVLALLGAPGLITESLLLHRASLGLRVLSTSDKDMGLWT